MNLNVENAVNAVMARDTRHLERLADQMGVTTQEVLATLVRACICAPEGRELAVVDFSSIEARGLIWLAGDEEGLAPFRAGIDAYRRGAAQLLGMSPESVTGEQRQLGKSCELGCGYQMGGGGFQAYAKGFGVNWDTLLISPAHVVESWRDQHPHVAGWRTGERYKGHVVRRGGLWKDLEAATYHVVIKGRTAEAGRCTWAMSSGDLHCLLPSGRTLVYRDACLEPTTTPWGEKRDTVTYADGASSRVVLYGGKLAENVTQAVCRDLLAEALVRLEDAGFPVVLHVHDEAVCEVKRPETLQAMSRIVKEVPSWAEGLPIDVEGYCAQRYRKG